ncbi:hypothetical protein [uncultured Luteimonas sp.]|uniref:hypothetical protein n=1 Tax=uncultured Luteimonas sp. TaxID=453144 RepID=UPI00262C57A7|nr:hypothetical protein [uncultured Luteimonas sp.]
MDPTPAPATTGTPTAAVDGAHLAALLQAGDIDAAIDAGLMEFRDDPALDLVARALIQDVRLRLRQAWDARERYRAREVRLATRAQAREARRNPATAAPAGTPRALPPAAAAALARARARAGGA